MLFHDKAVFIADTVMQFEPFAGRRTGGFVLAVCKVIEAGKVPIDEVIAAYQANQDKLTMQANAKDYLTNLETIINIGKSKRRIIY